MRDKDWVSVRVMSANNCLLLWTLLAVYALHAVNGQLFIPMTRAEVLAALGAKESRLYFASCVMSKRSDDCAMAMDLSEAQELSQCAISVGEMEKPYWYGVLETPAYIVSVSLLDVDHAYLGSSFNNALKNIAIQVSGTECAVHRSNHSFVKRTFPCDRIGDDVAIQSIEVPNEGLAICEVEVVGVPLQFPTTGGDDRFLVPSGCEIRYGENRKSRSRCPELINNQTGAANCVKTKLHEYPFVEILYDNFAVFHKVHVYSDNRDSLKVEIHDQPCKGYLGQNDSRLLEARCDFFGSRIRISSRMQQNEVQVQLCAVLAFGHPAADLRPVKYKHLGCFKDVMEERDLPQLVSGFDMSVEKCWAMCKREGMRYFGLQNGRLCFCGSSHGRHGRAADEAACSKRCPRAKMENGREKEATEFCGGPLLNSVYELVGGEASGTGS